MEYLYTKISIMTNIKIFEWDCETDEISCYGVLAEQSNPLILSEELRELLKNRIMNQKTPVIYQDENKVIFCGMREKMTKMLLLGPICIEDMSYVEIHRYCKAYQIENEQCPPKLKLQNLLALLELLSYIKIEEKYEDEEILDANGLIEKQEIGLEADVRIDTEDIYHHTYQEEVKTMDYIREGNLEEVVGAVELLASTAGKLSENEIRNERNLGICSITLATRAAIEGGAAPAKAYKLSDLYINKIDQCKRMTEIFEYRKRSLYDFAKLVVEEREKRANSRYTEQCKEYIRKYYHQKICIPDIAEALGVSESHLSRILKKETGESIQKYSMHMRIERAENLLKYSEASLTEISEYLCFSSQSHFGKVFKVYKNMTPKQYRDYYKSPEFVSREEI
ncbi:helix-turn-helix transcriptional regulator [[Ruminococcus] gnavus]|uniref:AraC family transcriptional regulator n=1 Tax=Mediterraneibacter gnavus TaxID=33038 RepID=A0AAJ1EPU7_MEDGN|nr:AraC family transcriptional regulator [Mediterraneibacter gnavus]MCC3678862.1 AraC family transcriptional regulator [[Clostridium] nexile]MCB5492682.1 AraC family transcriptional regulator [Mediterraneibacter gnavus]MCB5592131.1 AraC family transcriptional regulator [Mediterraneibacter gnavus]MCB5604936.1 AraC family transcriptional regulator [Mediterraneibacter gnavus]MCG4522769.1 AraC family transcriptional regulator [Mediterraneibacter gnavus]